MYATEVNLKKFKISNCTINSKLFSCMKLEKFCLTSKTKPQVSQETEDILKSFTEWPITKSIQEAHTLGNCQCFHCCQSSNVIRLDLRQETICAYIFHWKKENKKNWTPNFTSGPTRRKQIQTDHKCHNKKARQLRRSSNATNVLLYQLSEKYQLLRLHTHISVRCSDSLQRNKTVSMFKIKLCISVNPQHWLTRGLRTNADILILIKLTKGQTALLIKINKPPNTMKLF